MSATGTNKASCALGLDFTGVGCRIISGFWSRIKARGEGKSPWTTILSNVSATCSPGKITAIMGPTGAGKTTLLDILAGRKNTGSIEGEVLVGGHPREKINFKKISGYVLQDPKLMGTATVIEHLVTVALLRLSSKIPRQEILLRVQQVMEELGIVHIADRRIGTDLKRGISGGERKRLCIASELVADPSILLLDEPTSGLDSGTAKSLIDTLRGVASERKCTIIMTIHQPRSNIYDSFDQVLLLAKGRTAYCGPGNQAIEYFSRLGYVSPENFNPADFLLDLLAGGNSHVESILTEYEEEKYDALTSSREIEDSGEEVTDLLWKRFSSNYSSTFSRQFLVLSKRTGRNILRDPHLLTTTYSITLFLALLLGWIYWNQQLDLAGVQNRAGCLFFVASLLSFAAMGSVEALFNERAVYVRERAEGMYSTGSYFLSKAVCDLIPLRVLPPLVMGSIIYYMVGLMSPIHHFLFFLLGLTLISLCAGSMCLAISSTTPTVGVGTLLGIGTLLFNMLFAGFLLNKLRIPPFIGLIKYLSFIQYGFEALLVNELIDRERIVITAKGISGKLVITGRQFLIEFGMDPDRRDTDLIVLGCIALAFLLTSYLSLRFLVKEKR